MKKAIIIFLTLITVFALAASAVYADSGAVSDETSLVAYQSEGNEAKKLEWVYYVIGLGTVALVIGAAVIISKKR